MILAVYTIKLRRIQWEQNQGNTRMTVALDQHTTQIRTTQELAGKETHLIPCIRGPKTAQASAPQDLGLIALKLWDPRLTTPHQSTALVHVIGTGRRTTRQVTMLSKGYQRHRVLSLSEEMFCKLYIVADICIKGRYIWGCNLVYNMVLVHT